MIRFYYEEKFWCDGVRWMFSLFHVVCWAAWKGPNLFRVRDCASVSFVKASFSNEYGHGFMFSIYMCAYV